MPMRSTYSNSSTRCFGAMSKAIAIILLASAATPAGRRPAQQKAPTPLTIMNTSLAPAKVGVDYKETIYPDGGKFPYEFSGTGLPPGLAFGYASDTIYGKATTAGSYDVVITVKDGSKPPQTATLKTKLTVSAN
jgi:hypothetical protein